MEGPLVRDFGPPNPPSFDSWTFCVVPESCKQLQEGIGGHPTNFPLLDPFHPCRSLDRLGSDAATGMLELGAWRPSPTHSFHTPQPKSNSTSVPQNHLQSGMEPESSSSSSPPKATIGILSIGDMGMGIAKLLRAHNYSVVTSASGRR